MTCEEFRDAVVASIYGAPSAEDLGALREHADGCSRCARIFERTIALHGACGPAEHAPLPDREKSWRVIRERSFARPRRFAYPLPSRRLALAAAGAAVVFVVGAFVGRLYLFPPAGGPSERSGPSGAAGGYENIASVPIYLETIEPLLVDFLNGGDRRADEESARLIGGAVDEMLARTRVLKAAAIRGGDRELYRLLDDVEIALISISNLGGQNGESASQIERFIREEALVPKLRVLASQGTI